MAEDNTLQCRMCLWLTHPKFGITDVKGVFICNKCLGNVAQRLADHGVTPSDINNWFPDGPVFPPIS